MPEGNAATATTPLRALGVDRVVPDRHHRVPACTLVSNSLATGPEGRVADSCHHLRLADTRHPSPPSGPQTVQSRRAPLAGNFRGTGKPLARLTAVGSLRLRVQGIEVHLVLARQTTQVECQLPDCFRFSGIQAGLALALLIHGFVRSVN